MEDHWALSDTDLMTAMERGDLKPTLFSHEAHLRWGWLLLDVYGLDGAMDRACMQLRRYTRVLGFPEKYNETVTVAAIKAIHHFRLRSDKASFEDFIRDFPRLKTSFKELMGFHYSWDIFSEQKAKKAYIEPDLLPFD